MTQTSVQAPAARAASAWRRMWLWATAHAVDDLYQGLVPACVPYFVLDRHYGYVAASGLTMAAALGSSIPQPFIGLAVDRFRLGWLAAAGVALAGLGLGLSGLVEPYPVVWALVLLSGLGVAMFHPAAGKGARETAGDSATAMSVFAAGGSVGFFLAPVLATPVLIAMGVGATVLFIPPALLVAFALLRNRPPARAGAAGTRAGTDRWAPFMVLTGIEVVRSVTFFGVLTFIELFWIRHLDAGRGLAGAAWPASWSAGSRAPSSGDASPTGWDSCEPCRSAACSPYPRSPGCACCRGPACRCCSPCSRASRSTSRSPCW